MVSGSETGVDHPAAVAFIQALAERDFAALQRCLAPDVTFRALLPGGVVEVSSDEEATGVLEHWFAVYDRFERCPDADFRFSESDVPADQPVHRFGPFHIALGFNDGAHLVGRLLIDKSALEFALPRRIRRKGMPSLRFASGLNGE